MPNLVPLKDLRTFKGLIFEHLGLSSDQEEFLEAVANNQPVTETAVYDLVDVSLEDDKEIATDVSDLTFKLSPGAAAGLQLGLYAPESELLLAGVVVPALHTTSKTLEVGTDQIACGLELAASLGLRASASGDVKGWKLGLSGGASLDLVLRFFKLLKKDVKARDAVTRTVGSLTSFFHVTSNTLQAGEIAVADFRGTLNLGASLDYGWSVKGTKQVTPGLDIELAAHYDAKAQLGLSADLKLDSRFVVVVQRSTAGDKWVNVCFMKRRESDVALAANLSVEAKLDTRIGLTGEEKTDVGPFVDSLLGRTSLPDLIGELERFDSAGELEDLAATLAGEFAHRLTGEIERLLEKPVAQIEARILQPIRDKIGELVAAYREIDREVASFLSRALEEFEDKAGIDQILETLDGLETPDDLLALLTDEGTADDIRKMLRVFDKLFGGDVSQLAMVEEIFARIQGLTAQYKQQKDDLLQQYSDAYQWLKKQVRIDDAVDKIEAFAAEQLSLQELVDEQILWLNEYLEQEIGEALDDVAAVLEPVAEVLARITGGYAKLVAKAKAALEKALDHELSLRANLAWNRVRTNQALASIDVNLDEAAGRKAMRQLMSGDVAEVMKMRLTNVHAIRFQRSHFLDDLRRSVSIKTVVNGREKLRIKSYLVSTTAVLEPTENGEIWAATTRVGETFQRSNRQAMINVGTILEFSAAEELVVSGLELESQGIEIAGRAIDYSYREQIHGAIDGFRLAQRLIAIDRDLELRPVPLDAFNSLLDGVQDVGSIGDLEEVSIEIGYSIDGNALQRLFDSLDPDEIEEHFRRAWDRAAVEVFGELRGAIRFFESRKGTRVDISEFGAPSNGLTAQEQVVARGLIHKRETVPELMAKLHRDVFVNLRTRQLAKILKRLGKNMNWVNDLEFEPTRNFIMSVFAAAVGPSELGGSFAVRYKHPMTGREMQLRADVPSIAQS